MTTLIKRLVLCYLLLLVLIPVLQAKFNFWEEKPLGGVYTLAPEPEFSWESLRDNTFQPALEQHLEDYIGFRPFLVRLRNQLAFSLFHVTHASGTTVGQHDVLFEILQAKSYGGYQLMDEATVQAQVRRLRVVQRDLAQRGVKLLFVMAPNKARFLPEELPGAMRPASGTPSNYDRYRRALLADTVEFLDMVPLFASWKKTSPHPLFTRAGTHWSAYGASLAADTLLRRLERIGDVRFPPLRTTGKPLLVYATDSLQGNDNDLAKPMNLLQQTERVPAAYPQLAFDPLGPGQSRPPALFVGDSFLWGFTQFTPYLQTAFTDDSRIWYYGIGIYMPDKPFTYTGRNCQDVDLRQQIESRRFIILLTTEHNLFKREFDFTNRVYRLYHPLTPTDQAAIEQITQQIIRKSNEQEPDSAWVHQAQEGYMSKIRAQAEDIYENQRHD
jgi:hypothetical protein